MRVATWLLWGLFVTGGLLVIAGAIELGHLNENLPIMEQKSTFLAEAQRSAGRMHDSAALALGLGIFNLVGALLFWPVLAVGMRGGRALILIFVAFVAACQVLLIVQDGTIGVVPYEDLSHDLGQEKLINSLIVAPGYFVMLYPAESAGLILAVLIGWKMLQDSTVEHFQRRRRVTADRTWDVSEILAKRQNGAP
ncbi:MAG TPA: hypothetical protein VFC19_36695 [Candidatus Limnocylindrales bacterium]|nr:hypothetical protein [Candidatus Limnocylindrales bacterium]